MKVLDLFAGTGWGVACKWLGIEEMGVEIMPEAVATRTANGMETIFGDVWDGLEGRADVPDYDGLLASPPCQTYSMAGRGAGREALDEVIMAVNEHLYKDPAQLREFGEKHDPRTALVLTPLAYIWRDKPSFVVLEQVPTVQPVWEAYAVIMREWGYSVETAILNAEQYGVPQTRRRSILVARLDGPVSLPTPTHSRYYPRTPEKLDAGVMPWISMAEALGWTAGGSFTQNNKLPNQAIRTMDRPAPTVTAGHDSGNRGFIGADGFTVATPEQVAALQSYPKGMVYRNGNQKNAARRTIDQPAPTVHFGQRSNKVEWMPADSADDVSASGTRVSTEEAAALQSYPEGWGFTSRPAMTVTGHGMLTRSPSGQKKAVVDAADAGEYRFRPPFDAETAKKADYKPQESGYLSASEMFHADAINCSPEENAVLQSYPKYLRSNYGTSGDKDNRGERSVDQPAATLTSKASRNKWDGKVGMEPGEAAALQTYEKPFVWCGARSKQYLQIGNAVPPVLALAVLSAIIKPASVAATRRRRTLV